jgi:acyl-ACP thioesterase
MGREFLSFDIVVPNRDTDTRMRLKVSSLFAYYQDVAAMHSEEIGTGLDVFGPRGIAWVLMRSRVEIARMPVLGEKITVETWPLPGRTLFDRDFFVMDEAGEVIVRTSSIWLVIDLESRAMLKNPEIEYTIDSLRDFRATEKKPSKIRMPADGEFCYAKTVRFSDTDYNFHLNNTKYVDMLMDAVDYEVADAGRLSVVEINYSNEARVGDVIDISRAAFEQDGLKEYTVEGRCGEETQIFTAKAVFTS